jgi:serine O-acetyltransferase
MSQLNQKTYRVKNVELQAQEKDEQLPNSSTTSVSLWQEIQADAVANGGEPSFQRTIKLFLLHSGFQLLSIFRIQQRLRKFGGLGNLFADFFLKFATDLTGCHIYPDVYLEGGIHLPHATGIVIGKGAIVRSHTTIYQNVTLGRRTGKEGGCPELRPYCTVYAGAQILGNVVIGQNAIVGANSVVLESVPDNAVAVGIPARIIQQK